MRYWLLTNTTYGTWLAGDRRGSVTSVRERRPGEVRSASRIEHDKPGEAWEPPLPGLQRSAESRLKSSPILLTKRHAQVLLAQFRETASYRDWRLLACSIMPNHFHVVLAVSGDPEPRRLLIDLKAYGSRALNREFGKPASGKWWTANGSKRKLPDERAVASAVNYVLHKQPNPLIVWSPKPHDGEP